MNLFQIIILIVIRLYTSAATKVLYVLPESSANATSCPSQPCATLGQYLLNNGTLPVTSNVEYHFLPGEHYIPANIVLHNLYNFSIIGSFSKTSSAMLVGCSYSYVISITDSQIVTFVNVMFKHCNSSLASVIYKRLSSLKISCCFSCKIENATFLHYGIKVHNLIGKSYLKNVMIKTVQHSQLCCQEIILQYSLCPLWNAYIDHTHDVTIKQLYIHNYTKQTTSTDDSSGIYVDLENTMYNVNIVLTDSQFYNMKQKALQILMRRSAAKRNIFISNCTFQFNTAGPAIAILMSPYAKNVTIIDSRFLDNSIITSFPLIEIKIHERKRHNFNLINNTFPLIRTKISFIRCEFRKNMCKLLLIQNMPGKISAINLLFKSLNILYNVPKFPKHTDLIIITNMNIHICSPINVSYNLCKGTIIKFQSCYILLDGEVRLDKNYCKNVISLDTHIKIMEYSKITVKYNKYQKKIIDRGCIEEYYQPYRYCLFQYITKNNLTITKDLLTHYDISIENNVAINDNGIRMPSQNNYCSVSFCHFLSHCKWIPSAVFHNNTPEYINKQIIKNDDQHCNYHNHICYCSQTVNCSVDLLGPVYPGQTLQTEFCNMCSNDSTVLYAEVQNIYLPNSSCKVAQQSQLINVIGNHSNTVKYTIVSSSERCELFLTASSFFNKIYDAFYVQLLPCPVGFTLQNGMCDCDPILPVTIDKCYIDYSAIERPANTWIVAHSEEANNTKYLTSECPMDYCLPHVSIINLLHPDLQCQFNRTGILCSQCQHSLSMVFGSSKCIECANVYILIAGIILAAGILLVLLLYFLNFTVTNGTISGIIFYANIISINDSIFLTNDTVFKPLKVFISFVNLDLGIQTCFYNGMDSYAKMWLQLFFPLYLTVIAISIIIASRYSSRILRITYTRSLPVLATLFLLSYTGVLRTVLTVLFSYSTITHLPGHHQQIVWSIDASIPLFGLKFTILFITCLVLFLLLITFNLTLLFTRYSLQFRLINHFKPLLDAFQGSHKNKYNYWLAMHNVLRSVFFALYGFQIKLRLIIATMILVLFTAYHGYTHPHKNKLVNIQELLLLVNLTIVYAASYHCSKNVFAAVISVMISLAYIQFCTLVLYHFLTYTYHCNITNMLQRMRQKIIFTKSNRCQNSYDIGLLDIPECTYNYNQYQDGLVSDDFN